MPLLTPQERIGTVIAGRYRIESMLGQGGMGVVLGGRHELTGRPIAIKLLLPSFVEEPELIARFFQEAKAAAALNHPNVVDVLDMGQEDGDAYLVLELLEGESLHELLEHRGKVPADELLTILLPVIDALSAAHEQGIVHRDLKPDNIFIHRDIRGRAIPKVLDFGIAKLLEVDSSVKTRTGGVLGTPHYMSPEQAHGMKVVGGETDIWSMGVLLYECLSGELPFAAESVPALLLQICTFDPLPLSERAPEIDPRLAAVVHRAFAREREERFASMEELGGALIAVSKVVGIDLPAQFDDLFPPFRETELPAQAVISRTSTGPMEPAAVEVVAVPATPPRERSRLPLVGAALLALLALGAIGGWVLHDDDPPAAAEPTVEVPATVEDAPAVEEPPPEEPSRVPPDGIEPPMVRTVDSDPPGAQVYEGETLLGTTPFEVDLATMPGQTLEIELRAAGYLSRRMNVGPDSSSHIVVDLPARNRRPLSGANELAPR